MNSEVLSSELIRDEGLRLKPYRDSVGKLTIGIGRNLDDVGISENEARFLLLSDITHAEADLDRALPWWRNLDEVRQRVMVNLCFNMGIGDDRHGLLSFRNTIAKIRDGDYLGASQALLQSKWAEQVGTGTTEKPGRALRLALMMRDGGNS